ncbi:hypothetical protein [Thermocoleostomius sinensis]|uniref:Uncharacterized protein n=1 Tax=Thermocoleostomius sinensis A174 TaxID=2016057 RepID=A0A9E9CC69_9CYAN|nr:hypothetical protein [Thermocoleostomius sinensis]WAL62150.1 hypothetical protein OXH18_09235 [Thermocoleostomius sinensis A174]
MRNKMAIKLGTVGAIMALVGTGVPVIAHQVQVVGEVGGTLHIEPNDNPRAGVPSLAWFALTRQGGELIPLEACNCQLFVYAQPYRSGEAPVQVPALEPVSAEGYENVPGAEITFPQVGAYELVLQGEPHTTKGFEPFELRFNVTVAAGQSTALPTSPSTDALDTPDSSPIATPSESEAASDRVPWFVWVILLVILAIALPLVLARARKK